MAKVPKVEMEISFVDFYTNKKPGVYIRQELLFPSSKMIWRFSFKIWYDVENCSGIEPWRKEGRTMKNYLKRILPLLLLAAMLTALLLPAAAMDGGMPPEPPGGFGAPPGGPGGGGGTGAAGQEFATYDEVRSSAAILFEGGAVDENFEGRGFVGEYTVDPEGEITENGVSGLSINGGEGANGIAIEMGSESDVFTIGGEEDLMDGFNSVIKVKSGEKNNDAGYEAVHGVGVGINTGQLRIINSYIYSEGPRSTPVYAFSTQSPGATSVVAVDSRLETRSDSIWMPPFKLLAGGSRATLLMTRNHSWFYGTEVLSNNWGAISQDSVDAMTYVVNSSGISTEGGYGTYLTYGMRLYGSDLYAGQYGVFMCGTSDILTDTGAAALEDADAMSKAPDYAVDTERVSHVVAPFNAIVVHNSLPDYTMVAKGIFKNTLVSTMAEDLPDSVTPMSYDDPFFMPGVDIIGSGAGCGASYFYNKNLYGSLTLIRSMNADMTFDNADTRTSNGVLVHSVVTYDPPQAVGYLTPEQGDQVSGVTATFLNGDYQGDLLHQDYQRSMTVTVGENAVVTGKAVSGTYAAWNYLWTDENLSAMLTEDGYTPDVFENDAWAEDVRLNLIRSEDTVYEGTENRGITMTVAQGGTWNVTGDSSLKQLVIEEGGTVAAPEGGTITVYTGCDTSNSLLFYDESAGTPVEELTPGTYDNVVIRVEGTPVVAAPEEEGSVEESAECVETEPIPDATEEAPAEEPAEEPAPETVEKSSNTGLVVGVIVVVAAVAAVVAVALKKKKK